MEKEPPVEAALTPTTPAELRGGNAGSDDVTASEFWFCEEKRRELVKGQGNSVNGERVNEF